MDIDYYENIFRLTQETSGITVRDTDLREPIERYFLKNVGLSFVIGQTHVFYIAQK